jgi:GNAT superfamily N-acetyltransferase
MTIWAPTGEEDRVTGEAHLSRIFDIVGHGGFVPFDAEIEVIPRVTGAIGAVIAFSGHHVLAADVDPEWVAAHCPHGDLSAPLGPPFLQALSQRLDAAAGAHDLLLAAPGRTGAPELELEPVDETIDHPRIRRSLRYRPDTRAYRTPDGAGLLAVGRGLAGRWEAAFEVAPEARGRGLGRALAGAALYLIEPDRPLFMQVAVGNIASLRAVLAAGLIPVGAEVLFT